MKLEDINYYARLKKRLPDLFSILLEVYERSMAHKNDSIEVQRKLKEVSNHSGLRTEQRRQAVNLACEMLAYNEAMNDGNEPHWVPEQNVPMPDISVEIEGRYYPIEVKHLEEPRDEDDALSTSGWHSGAVNHEFYLGIEKKVDYFSQKVLLKFEEFNNQYNKNRNDASGTLRLYYSRGIDALLILDEIDVEDIIKSRFESLETRGASLQVSRFGDGFEPNLS